MFHIGDERVIDCKVTNQKNRTRWKGGDVAGVIPLTIKLTIKEVGHHDKKIPIFKVCSGFGTVLCRCHNLHR